jgi:hypothetical protein
MREYEGNLVVGGNFTSQGNNIATWNGSSWDPMEGGVDDVVLAMEIVDGELLLFGDFLHVSGQESSFIAAWRSATPVHLTDFQVAAVPNGVHLQWQLTLESLADLTSVMVQRSYFAEGPFEDVSGHLPPDRFMEFTDPTAVTGEEYWYRLAGRTQAGALETSLAISTRVQPLAESYLYAPILDGGRVQVRYQIATQAGPIRLGVYDVRGRLVRSLAAGAQPPGEYRVLWDGTLDSGTRVARGVYFLNLQARGTHVSHKVVLSTH